MADTRSALIVVDMQEDFCPPNGSMAVNGGRDISGIINDLLQLSFTAKVASQDWHPQDHISFDTQHTSSHKKAFEDTITVSNPDDDSETQDFQVWPVHCIRETHGAKIISEIDSLKFDLILKKGLDKRTEMFSAFGDKFSRKGNEVVSDDLDAWLKNKRIRKCFVVGLTGDCCVRDTAIDAAKHGYETFVIEDATRSVSAAGWKKAQELFDAGDVTLIQSDDPRLRSLRE